ncbi:flagellar hook-basal body complex protein FliE [Hydrogenovibrio thermophilus]|uniref:Flagellar hook-basal body complex protein FliE n=1 Tax=Hydrogenovibrio thermophilus TaxID=265883 RepID=A0A410H412_9GAMM|nr:flagellar hook-basal body complex protein FliE [Hydrogenovibrio thermophilus]QAB15560.1 flagellar hook-basal body complex protein FliE [Hydrogenovibrio thermophilus]
MTNSVDTQSLMLQMRSLAAEAASQSQPVKQPEKGAETAGNFAELLSQSVNSVAEEQNKSSAMKTAFEKGEDVDLTEVMVQAQKASLSFQAMTQVRNKLVEAYKDIKNMPI